MSVVFQRKFLVKDVPEHLRLNHLLDSYVDLRQYYWNLGSGWSLRYRHETSKGEVVRESVTVKGQRTEGSYNEFAFTLPPAADITEIEVRRSFVSSANTSRIIKRRYFFELDGIKWRLDQFHAENEGLWLIETEDPNSREIAALDWFDRDVTAESRYANERLASWPLSRWS